VAADPGYATTPPDRPGASVTVDMLKGGTDADGTARP